GDLTLSNIRYTPSCGDASAPVCVGPRIDPGVFTVSASAVGGNNTLCTGVSDPFPCCTGAGAGTCQGCDGLTFTVAVTDVTTGEVTFSPNATVKLGQPGASTDTCIIDFTLDVKALPTVDASPDAGVQTAQLARVTGFHAGTRTSGSAGGA